MCRTDFARAVAAAIGPTNDRAIANDDVDPHEPSPAVLDFARLIDRNR